MAPDVEDRLEGKRLNGGQEGREEEPAPRARAWGGGAGPRRRPEAERGAAASGAPSRALPCLGPASGARGSSGRGSPVTALRRGRLPGPAGLLSLQGPPARVFSSSPGRAARSSAVQPVSVSR